MKDVDVLRFAYRSYAATTVLAALVVAEVGFVWIGPALLVGLLVTIASMVAASWRTFDRLEDGWWHYYRWCLGFGSAADYEPGERRALRRDLAVAAVSTLALLVVTQFQAGA